jgi:putative phage-type endonuclease
MLQRSPEWFAARVGKVTASRISDVLAELADKKKEATGRRNYRRELALEMFTGLSQESGYTSFAMQQGMIKEETARNTYAFDKNLPIEEIGFVPHPTIERAGASPDGLVGSDGVLELKCPEASAMWEMLTKHPLDKKYRDQVMWQLACTGRQWGDVVFYRDGCPLEIIHIERDETYIKLLESAVRAFLAEVDADYQLLCKMQPRRT